MVCLAVVLPEHEDLRIVACVFLVSWSRILAPALRCKICCRYLGLEQIPQHSYTICLTAFWSRSGAPALTCTICCLWCQHEDVRFRVGVLVCCRYLCLEKVPQHSYSQFVDGVFVSKWCFSIEMYGFLSVSWSIAGVLASKWVPKHDLSERCPSIQMYDLFVGVFVSKWCPLRCVAGVLEVVLRTKMYGLLSMSWF